MAAQGEAEHGCAQGEPCRRGHDQPVTATHPRRPCLHHQGEQAVGRAAERAEDEPAVPRQRAAEPAHLADEPSPEQGCRSELAGWAGAHRHGAVRPLNRRSRRERPPSRWC
ncbi:hypothetical protein ACFWDK_13275 [Micromonospora chalcea]|uniref:hypothetical protein n=1 Tax=Micromonospora sp. TSRI0369 TaxID=1703936 RepID=UPI00093F8E20|nr:hypothetical protein [Micromonospora sp. TSRI0369]OKJ36629.1 hypothetical protein AMK25_27395 [Micromonospora sp. TSRI0369]